MNTVKIALISNWDKMANMFLQIHFIEKTGKWETVNKNECQILTKLKLAARFSMDKPDPPNAYDLLLREAGKKGIGLETFSEEEE
jgi:hypothetical protein